MLPAIGAAALALDAIQSLTSSASASTQPQSSNPGLSFSDAIGDSASVSQGSSTAVSGFSGGSQISPGNFSALLDAQGQSSVGSTGFDASAGFGGSADASPSGTGSLSASASSTYNAVDRLGVSQSGTVPLGITPLSLSV